MQFSVYLHYNLIAPLQSENAGHEGEREETCEFAFVCDSVCVDGKVSPEPLHFASLHHLSIHKC